MESKQGILPSTQIRTHAPMRPWIFLILATSLVATTTWLLFGDAWRMHRMLGAIEGRHSLDLISEGALGGSYLSEFERLEDGGFRTGLTIGYSLGNGSRHSLEHSLEFEGFPSYRIRSVKWKADGEDKVRQAHELPQWSLYEHLILQRLAYEGPDLLHRESLQVELLSFEERTTNEVRASLRAPVLRPASARIEPIDFEIAWHPEEGVTLYRGDAWYKLDGFGRIAHVHEPFIGELVPAGSIDKASPYAEPDLWATYAQLNQTIESPHQVREMRLEIGTGERELLATDEYLPVQEIMGNELLLRGGSRLAPERLKRLVARVHHSLVYDESANATDVEEIIANGRGDCTEFTDLFAARAEDAGYQVRKILGLAYSQAHSGRPEGFHVHAWNQVSVDGEWLDVDATWNQASPSATRIRFPQDPGRQLALLKGLDEFEFELIDLGYSSNLNQME